MNNSLIRNSINHLRINNYCYQLTELKSISISASMLIKNNKFKMEKGTLNHGFHLIRLIMKMI